MFKQDPINNIIIDISISDDYYEAYLNLYIPEGQKVTREELVNAITEKNITYGICIEAIDDIVQNQKSVNNVLIAKGKPHINGEDGKILYNFDIMENARPTILEDGRVDYKNLNIYKTVNKGEIIAKKIPPKEGIDGITVTGKTVKARKGKEYNFKLGKNVILSEDKSFVIADRSGLIKIIDNKISVVPVLEIKGNVGIKTGNISFNGKVTVNGNVERGYEINCEDDVEILGIVEGAKIYTKGNIIISRGSNNSDLKAEGSVIARYLEGCTVFAKNCIECEAVLHSNIESEELILKGKGLLIGGNAKIKKRLKGKVIGTHIGTTTKIQLGIDETMLEEYKKLGELIKSLRDNINKLNTAINVLQRQKQNERTGIFEKEEVLRKSFNTREKYVEQLNKYYEQYNDLTKQIRELKEFRIYADTIYPGVKIKINNSFFNPQDILKDVILGLKDGEIKNLKIF